MERIRTYGYNFVKDLKDAGYSDDIIRERYKKEFAEDVRNPYELPPDHLANVKKMSGATDEDVMASFYSNKDGFDYAKFTSSLPQRHRLDFRGQENPMDLQQFYDPTRFINEQRADSLGQPYLGETPIILKKIERATESMIRGSANVIIESALGLRGGSPQLRNINDVISGKPAGYTPLQQRWMDFKEKTDSVRVYNMRQQMTLESQLEMREFDREVDFSEAEGGVATKLLHVANWGVNTAESLGESGVYMAAMAVNLPAGVGVIIGSEIDQSYNDMRRAGIDPEIAYDVSSVVGTFNGAMEAGSTYLMKGVVTGGKSVRGMKPFQSFEKKLTDVVSSKFVKTAARGTAGYVADVLPEIGTELSQYGASTLGFNLAADINNKENGTNIQKREYDQVGEVIKQTVSVSSVFSGMGMTRRGVERGMQRVRRKEFIKEVKNSFGGTEQEILSVFDGVETIEQFEAAAVELFAALEAKGIKIDALIPEADGSSALDKAQMLIKTKSFAVTPSNDFFIEDTNQALEMLKVDLARKVLKGTGVAVDRIELSDVTDPEVIALANNLVSDTRYESPEAFISAVSDNVKTPSEFSAMDEGSIAALAQATGISVEDVESASQGDSPMQAKINNKTKAIKLQEKENNGTLSESGAKALEQYKKDNPESDLYKLAMYRSYSNVGKAIEALSPTAKRKFLTYERRKNTLYNEALKLRTNDVEQSDQITFLINYLKRHNTGEQSIKAYEDFLLSAFNYTIEQRIDIRKNGSKNGVNIYNALIESYDKLMTTLDNETNFKGYAKKTQGKLSGRPSLPSMEKTSTIIGKAVISKKDLYQFIKVLDTLVANDLNMLRMEGGVTDRKLESIMTKRDKRFKREALEALPDLNEWTRNAIQRSTEIKARESVFGSNYKTLNGKVDLRSVFNTAGDHNALGAEDIAHLSPRSQDFVIDQLNQSLSREDLGWDGLLRWYRGLNLAHIQTLRGGIVQGGDVTKMIDVISRDLGVNRGKAIGIVIKSITKESIKAFKKGFQTNIDKMQDLDTGEGITVDMEALGVDRINENFSHKTVSRRLITYMQEAWGAWKDVSEDTKLKQVREVFFNVSENPFLMFLRGMDAVMKNSLTGATLEIFLENVDAKHNVRFIQEHTGFTKQEAETIINNLKDNKIGEDELAFLSAVQNQMHPTSAMDKPVLFNNPVLSKLMFLKSFYFKNISRTAEVVTDLRLRQHRTMVEMYDIEKQILIREERLVDLGESESQAVNDEIKKLRREQSVLEKERKDRSDSMIKSSLTIAKELTNNLIMFKLMDAMVSGLLRWAFKYPCKDKKRKGLDEVVKSAALTSLDPGLVVDFGEYIDNINDYDSAENLLNVFSVATPDVFRLDRLIQGKTFEYFASLAPFSDVFKTIKCLFD